MLSEEHKEEQTQVIHDEPLSAPEAALLKLFTLSDINVIVAGRVACF